MLEMPFPRVVCVAALALLSAQLHGAGGDPPKGGTGTSIDCLALMNKERQAVGLVPFKAETNPQKKLPTSLTEGADPYKVKTVCDAILKADDPKGILFRPEEQSWTFLFTPEFGEEAGCENAVESWKEAIKNFDGFPPPYKSDAQQPYDWYASRSFVGLFNPQPNPTVDCVLYVCPYDSDAARSQKNKATQSAALSAQGTKSSTVVPATNPKSNKVDEDCADIKGSTELQTQQCKLAKGGDALKGVVCLTFPPPLVKDKSPFTEAQWKTLEQRLSAGKLYSLTSAASFILSGAALWVAAL